MTIYDIADRLSIGKDYPTSGPYKPYRPNIIGPGSGKIKAAIYAGYQIGKFILSRPWAKGTLTGTAIGTGLALDGFQDEETNGSSYSNQKALRSSRSNSYRSRRNRCPKNCNCKRHSC